MKKSNERYRNWLCPVCGRYFKRRHVLRNIKSATTDCDKCGTLLMIDNGKLYHFHQFLHKSCSEWPVDGKGTYSLPFGKKG